VKRPPTWSDEQIEASLGRLLQLGVAIAAAIVTAGGAFYLLRHGRQPPDYAQFHGVPVEFRTVTGILRSATAFGGRGLIELGLLVLIATPVARVAFSLVAFIRQSDRLYAWITATVLALLAYSVLGGIR